MKKEIVDGYLARLNTIPCRYFEQSIKDSDSSTGEYKFKCQFGNGCHYAHTHPTSKEPYVFSEEELLQSRRRRPRRRIDRAAQFLDEMAIMEMLFSDLAVGYQSNDEWVDEEDEDDDFGDHHLVFETEFMGLESGDFEDEFGYDFAWA
jgi:E3 ubiquitin-protein ligase makorin